MENRRGKDCSRQGVRERRGSKIQKEKVKLKKKKTGLGGGEVKGGGKGTRIIEKDQGRFLQKSKGETLR